MLTVKTLIPERSIFRRQTRLIGTGFEIGVVSDNAYFAEERIAAAVAEISRVETLLSVFNKESAVNVINRHAGLFPVKVNAEVFRLISRSLQIAELTSGAFDIAYHTPMPENETGFNAVVAKSQKVSYKQVILNTGEQTVFLKHKGMRIGFGGVVRGYAADRAKYILQMSGVNSGVINSNGDVLAWGLQPGNLPWTVASADPSQKGAGFSGLNISSMALATSVNTAGSAPAASKQLLNTICPEKGFQVSNIKSVSVISTTAEMAAAMASPLNAIGINAGLYLVNRLNQIACIYTDDQDRVYTSKGLGI